MLGIDECGRAPGLLRLGDHLQRQGRLTRGFRPEDFDHPSSREAAHTQRVVERNRAARNHRHWHHGLRPQPQNGTLAELLFHIDQRHIDSAPTFLFVHEGSFVHQIGERREPRFS